MAKDQAEVAELAADAKAIMNSKGFQAALDQMLGSAIQELLSLPVGDLRVPAAHARMKAVEGFKAELTSLLNDEKMMGTRHR